MVDKRRGCNLPKALCIREELTRWLNMRALSDNNPTKDLVVHKGSDVSINVQPEEVMQGLQIIEIYG